MHVNNQDWQTILTNVFCKINDCSAMDKFLADVLTEKELQEIASRLQAAVMLDSNEKYTSISDATGLSSRTVARISRWLKKDSGGYATAIKLVKEHHLHT